MIIEHERHSEKQSNDGMLFVTMVWGMTFVAVKTLFADISPANLIIVRFLSAACFLLLFIFLLRVKWPSKDFLYLCLVGGVGVTLYQFLWTYALINTSVINTSIILYSAPLFTMLLRIVARRERFKVLTILSIVIGFTGIYVLVAYGGPRNDGAYLKGNLFALGGALVWTLYTILCAPLLDRYSPIKVTAFTIVTGSILLCPLAPFFFNAGEFMKLSLAGWLVLAFTVLFSQLLAFFMWFKGLAILGPMRGVTFQYFVPAFAALFATVLLHEGLSLTQLVSGLIVSGSIVMIRRSDKERVRIGS